jgi:anion-transporting  ArsA/GET3 family ATPase
MGILSEQRFWIVTGKGGVGKSTVAAALALASARSGRRTLVCEVNAKERITAFLEHPLVGAQVKELEPNLHAVNVIPEQALREYALMVVRFETVYRAVFENRFVRYFLRFIPSLQELVMIGKITYHLRETAPDGKPLWDRIVMDAPATGHAVSFLGLPRVLQETVPPGPMAREAQIMRDLLEDPALTRTILVALPEEMPVNETIELHRTLQEQVGVRTGAAVLNMFIPHRFTDDEVTSAPPPVHDVARQYRAREKLSISSLQRLQRELQVPVLTVPRMYDPRVGRAVIERVAAHLGRLWEDG